MSDGDTTCPECGEPISATASYCMHCYADLPEDGAAGSTDASGATASRGGDTTDAVSETVSEAVEDITGGSDTGSPTGSTGSPESAGSTGSPESAGSTGSPESAGTAGSTGTAGSDQMLDPDGVVDNTLTVLVGVAGGVVIGLVGTMVLLVTTGSLWALPFGFLSFLVATAVLARQRTVQGAISKTVYGIAIVLLLVPVAMLSPFVKGGGFGGFVAMVFFVAIPAGIAAVIGLIAEQFVPEEE